ncbi:hypothetical protein P692DRAFT_20882129 [Suillus brevipes Sb2]|nr:hypothetical protein P692DRAFT_20882129 [Suillus brevipes Sb2]
MSFLPFFKRRSFEHACYIQELVPAVEDGWSWAVYSLDYARTRLANDAQLAKGGGARQFNGLSPPIPIPSHPTLHHAPHKRLRLAILTFLLIETSYHPFISNAISSTAFAILRTTRSGSVPGYRSCLAHTNDEEESRGVSVKAEDEGEDDSIGASQNVRDVLDVWEDLDLNRARSYSCWHPRRFKSHPPPISHLPSPISYPPSPVVLNPRCRPSFQILRL